MLSKLASLILLPFLTFCFFSWFWSGDGSLSVWNLRRNKVSHSKFLWCNLCDNNVYCFQFSFYVLFWCGFKLALTFQKFVKTISFASHVDWSYLNADPCSIWVFRRRTTICCYHEGRFTYDRDWSYSWQTFTYLLLKAVIFILMV